MKNWKKKGKSTDSQPRTRYSHFKTRLQTLPRQTTAAKRATTKTTSHKHNTIFLAAYPRKDHLERIKHGVNAQIVVPAATAKELANSWGERRWRAFQTYMYRLLLCQYRISHNNFNGTHRSRGGGEEEGFENDEWMSSHATKNTDVCDQGVAKNRTTWTN